MRRLADAGFSRLLGATRDQLDLRDQAAVNINVGTRDDLSIRERARRHSGHEVFVGPRAERLRGDCQAKHDKRAHPG